MVGGVAVGAVVTLVLGVLAYTDPRWRRLSNVIVGGLGLLGLGADAYALLSRPVVALWAAGSAAAVLASWAVFGGRGMGGGDAKLLVALCVAVGPLATGLLLGGASVGVVGTHLGMRLRDDAVERLPLAPFLLVAWLGLLVVRWRGL